MSALGGVCNWDGRPVSQDSLSALETNLRVAGPDASASVQPSPWLALQSHLLHFDRLSMSERQPRPFARQSFLTWDGRLDNRDDLLLCLHRELDDDHSDAAVVAAAYDKWGLDALPRLVGDWALAIWDAQQQRIILALDYMGNRPLYYRAEPNRIAWATRLEALAACENQFGAPDDAYIAGYLTKVGNPLNTTPFVGLLRLPGGHVLVATRNDTTIRRYWKHSPATLRYCDPRQYADHLRTLLTESVRVRLRSTRTVWAHLSGGWDSSSVVCVAHRLISHPDIEAPAIQPLSVVYEDPEAAQERKFMAAVERWCGVQTKEVLFRSRPTFAEMLGERVPMTAGEGFDLSTPVQAAGDRIVLTGTMGDMTTGAHGGGPLAMSEPFDSGHPIVALRGLRTYAHAAKRPLSHVILEVLKRRRHSAPRHTHVLPAGHRWSRARQRGPGYDGVSEELLRKAQARTHVEDPSCTEFPPTIRPLVKTLYRFAETGDSATPEYLRPIVWQTHPFLHRPLIEFMVAVPGLALFDPLFARAGMRRALIDILPPDILTRTSKVGILATSDSRSQVRERERLANALPVTEPLPSWALVKRGIVDSQRLSKDIASLHTGRRPTLFLTRAICIEAWLRSVATHPVDQKRLDTPADCQLVGARIGSQRERR